MSSPTPDTWSPKNAPRRSPRSWTSCSPTSTRLPTMSEPTRSPMPQHPRESGPKERIPMPRMPRRRVTRTVRRVPSETIRSPRMETTGGILLLIGAALALIAANSPLAGLYEQVRHTYIGIEGVFSLNVQHWAADFLLAFFFLVIGLELKRELVVGELREFKQAMLPVV